MMKLSMKDCYPCPYCQNKKLETVRWGCPDGVRYAIRCMNKTCGAIGPYKLTIDVARKKWNYVASIFIGD